MASIKTILKTEAGVTLSEVNLTTARGVVLATAWEVSSRRTSELRGSHTIETAERHFAEEVARCGTPAATALSPPRQLTTEAKPTKVKPRTRKLKTAAPPGPHELPGRQDS